MVSLSGLKSINIELTSRCCKECWMCGRRKIEKEHPHLAVWGDMPLSMVQRIAEQIPKGVFVQLHNNGEPLIYRHFNKALEMFKNHYTGLDTNGKALMDRHEAICKYLSSITISVIPDDPEGQEQLEIAEEFIRLENRPLTVFRMLGEIDYYRDRFIMGLSTTYPKILIARRQLHSPDGSFDYERPVTIPEHGICEEMLHKLCIDRWGNVFPCVRFDPHKKNLIRNIEDPIPDDEPRNYKFMDDGNHIYDKLWSIWHSKKRREWIQHHINGRRDLVPLCSECDYWGVPRG